MNWKECVKFNEAYDFGSRFEYPKGEIGFDCNDALPSMMFGGSYRGFGHGPVTIF